MKYLVAYNGRDSSKRALALALEQAKLISGKIYVVTSMEGGSGETLEAIQRTEDQLRQVKDTLAKEQVPCETIQLARGLSPGEDIVRFVQENNIDHVFIGIEKKSRASKLLLGSTAQYIILKGPCPVTTTK
jgi:nucleotide-binding universal stress UspA family protein